MAYHTQDTCTYTDIGTHRQIPFLHFTNLIFGTPHTHKYTQTHAHTQTQICKQKQQELAALNAKLKSLSKPVNQIKTQDNLLSLNKERVARESPSDGNSSEEDDVMENTVPSAQQAKVIPQ